MLTFLSDQYNVISRDLLTSKVAQLSDFHLSLHKVGLEFSILLSLFIVGVAVYIAATGQEIHHSVYTLLLCFMIMLVFLFRPFFKEPPSKSSYKLTHQHKYIAIFVIFAPLVIGISSLFSIFFDFSSGAVIANFFLAFLLLEATRRIEGWSLPIIIMVSIVLFLGFSDSPISNLHLLLSQEGVFSSQGIYGDAFTTVLKIVYIFTLFSFTLHLIRIDELLNVLAFKLTHERRSGASAALYAIFASSFYSAISGGIARDEAIYRVGRQTIPIMTQAGYPVSFAASIEAASSVVGQLMPPVMGVVAFIIVETSNFSYLYVMSAALIPVSLFILSLVIAAILEARKERLEPLELDASQKSFEQVIKEEENIYLKMFVLVTSFLVFAITLFIGIDLAFCGLATLVTAIILALLIPSQRFTVKDVLEALYESAKSGIIIGISCAIIGILLFVFKETQLSSWVGEAIAGFTSSHGEFIPLIEFFIELPIFVLAALIILILGMGLPTPAVYLIAAPIIEPILRPISNVEPIYIYMFVFYYAVLSGITAPYAILLKGVNKLVKDLIENNIIHNSKTSCYSHATFISSLTLSTLRLSLVAFLLPIAWIYHPEIMINNWTFANFSQVIYVLLSFIVAMIAIAVAQYGIFRRKEGVSRLQRYLLSMAAFLIILPNTDQLLLSLTVLGVFVALGILIYDDWHAKENSLLRPSVVMLQLILEPKNISATTIIIFISLIIVYTGFFSTSSLAHYLQNTLIQKWLMDRPHVVFTVDDCNLNNMQKTQDWFKQQGHDTSIACSPYAELTVSKITHGEVKIESVTVYEYQDNYFSHLMTLAETDDMAGKTRLEDMFLRELSGGERASCLDSMQEPLFAQNLNPINLYSLQCSQAESFPNPPKPLPLVYISQHLANELNLTVGSIISVHHSIHSEDLQRDIRGLSEQYFVVALIFELTSDHFEDLNNLILLPEQTLSSFFESSEDIEPDHKLIVKVNNLDSLGTLRSLLQPFEAEEQRNITNTFQASNILQFEIEKDHAITDFLYDQNGLLNGTQAIAFISGLICLLILVGGISQVIENNRKIIALMRISGLQAGVGATFILLLAIIGTLIPSIIGVMLSVIVNEGLASIFEDIAPEFSWFIVFDIGGVTLLMAIITAMFLTWLHFSNTIPQELRLCQQ